VVLMVPTTQPEDIASYANRVGNAWKIGRKDVGDGILVIVAKNDRKMRIEVAKTLEGAVPDLAASRIIDEEMKPRFRNNDFAGGLNAAVDRLIGLVDGEAAARAFAAAASGKDSGEGFDWENLAIFLFVGVFVGAPIVRAILGKKLGSVVMGGGIGVIAFFITTSIAIAVMAGLIGAHGVAVLGRGCLDPGAPRRWRRFRRLGRWWRWRLEQRRQQRRRWLQLRRRWRFRGRWRLGGLVGMASATHFSRLGRIWRHQWIDEADVRRVLPDAAMERLAARVAASERRHSGEIRICVEAGLPLSYLWRNASARERAVTLFGKLRVWDTEHNNGVLIYLLLAEHAIEIVADRGIDAHVDNAEWAAMTQRMGAAFREGRFEDGLTQALEEMSALLVAHFPLAENEPDTNELPDQPVVL
jgi:uncharacterized membrane protein YgcG